MWIHQCLCYKYHSGILRDHFSGRGSDSQRWGLLLNWERLMTVGLLDIYINERSQSWNIDVSRTKKERFGGVCNHTNVPCPHPICISIFYVRDMAHVGTDDLNNALLNDVSSSRSSAVPGSCSMYVWTTQPLEFSTCSSNVEAIPVVEAVADKSHERSSCIMSRGWLLQYSRSACV